MSEPKKNSDHPRSDWSIRPFNGSVKASFSDAIVASTDRALRAVDGSGHELFFIPFEDIYFTFLKRSLRTETRRPGTATCWDVSAVGESAPDVMISFDQPERGFEQLHGRGAFVSDAIEVEAEEAPDPEHEVHLP